MEFWELAVIAVGLSMDAFAVSICKGLSVGQVRPKHALICGLYFGGFQALMPLIGWLLGAQFQHWIEEVDHWIAFVLLVILGIKMIWETLCDTNGESTDASFAFREMFFLAVATSIDALAVGVTFAFLQVDIIPAVSLIGIFTFLFCALGVWLGSFCKAKWSRWPGLIGGVILIFMGCSILVEHLGLLNQIPV